MSLLFIIFFSLIFHYPLVSPQKTLYAPIQKDPITLLYTITLHLKTPPQPTKLHLDIGASFTWLDCTNYTSPKSKRISCSSPICASFHTYACANHSCSLYPENPITRQATLAAAFTDTLSLPEADNGSSAPVQFVPVPGFVFSCSRTFLLNGLAKDVAGLAALGRSSHSLPAQITTAVSSPRRFALCLSSSTGVVLFGSSGGGGSYSNSLVYTKLIVNPVGSTVISYGQQPSDEYFISLTSIKVNGKPVNFNRSQIQIDENGYGGTKISTDTPYTILESSIYEAFVKLFVNESAGLNLTVTNAVKPFDVCYKASDVIGTRVGPGVPTVDFVMESDDVFWRIFGSNSMVRIERDDVDVWCLGFVDGGVNMRSAVVIGGHQMEDNVIVFDLDENRFGFSSSLLLKGTNCANFKY
ncbi:probable aspartic proteinase GIP1 [Mercurialis annua]|uniref:probable aspartic proteinase GIP1 n=1 Tax=Mercurialis annua TaxID=3986 RepID=UPI0021603086|nr:probable aspartic proteinase GIP1 [Mercurialis annua]